MELLEVNSVNAWFGKFHAVKNVSLIVQQRDIFAIIGPSGCGKSTFIRCLNRLHEEIDSATMDGTVFLEGINIFDRTVDPVKIRRKIGMVFQKPNPFPALSIFENVVVGLKLAGIKKKSFLKEIAEKSLRKAALWD